MPEQVSRRGQALTPADLSAPFETLLVRLGARGLNLRDELDVLAADQCSRLTNVDHDGQGAVTSRPGQTRLARAGTLHHSVRKLSDPHTNTYTRIWGVDTRLYSWQEGELSQIDTGDR